MRLEDNNLTQEEAYQLLYRMGQRVKQKRTSKGISQVELAKKLAIQKASLSRIESGKTNITVYSLHKIAAALQLNEAELLAQFDRNAHSYESIVLLQAKYRRTSDTLAELAKELGEVLAAIKTSGNNQDRISMHEIARQHLARRATLITKLSDISTAMLKK